jgi:hypothetical protein
MDTQLLRTQLLALLEGGGIAPHALLINNINNMLYKLEEIIKEYIDMKEKKEDITPSQVLIGEEDRGGMGEKGEEDKLNKQLTKYSEPTQEEAMQYFLKHNSTAEQGQKFYNHYAALGWMKGRTRIAYWKIQANIWIENNRVTPFVYAGQAPKLARKVKEPWQLLRDAETITKLKAERQGLMNRYQLPSNSPHLQEVMLRYHEINTLLEQMEK